MCNTQRSIEQDLQGRKTHTKFHKIYLLFLILCILVKWFPVITSLFNILSIFYTRKKSCKITVPSSTWMWPIRLLESMFTAQCREIDILETVVQYVMLPIELFFRLGGLMVDKCKAIKAYTVLFFLEVIRFFKFASFLGVSSYRVIGFEHR